MRILLIASEGNNSRDILLDVEAGFRGAGHEVIRWELTPVLDALRGMGSHEERVAWTGRVNGLLRTLIESNGVELTVGMWANALVACGLASGQDGVLRSFFSLAGVPHAMFWLDAPHWAHAGQIHQLFGKPVIREPELFGVINNEGLAREMREVLGFGATLAEPYGVNTEVFRPVEGVAPVHDIVTNVGPGDPPPTERMLTELESDEPDLGSIRRDNATGARAAMERAAAGAGLADDGVRALIAAWVEGQLAEPGRPLMERLDAIAAGDAPLAEAFGRVRTNPSLFATLGEGARRIDRFRRAFTVSWLSRRLDVAVFGADPMLGWPHKATLMGEQAYREMSAAYAKGRIGLNVMRWQDDVGLNIKPLEITASGAACLCEHRTGLDGLFAIGEEIESFTSPVEALRKAEGLLADDGRRAAMAAAGLARTRRDHTWARWAASVVAFAERCAAERESAGGVSSSRASAGAPS